MPRKLKVFRTPAGFDDAYVAAPSRKAALAAWGADADLFARGVAEEVTDAALTAGPLAHPGEVVRRSRGSAAEHLATVKAKTPAKRDRARPPSKPAAPRPDPAEVDAAEAALEAMEKRHRTATTALARRQAELEREKKTLATEQAAERERLERDRRDARRRYDAALARWRG